MNESARNLHPNSLGLRVSFRMSLPWARAGFPVRPMSRIDFSVVLDNRRYRLLFKSTLRHETYFCLNVLAQYKPPIFPRRLGRIVAATLPPARS